MLKNREKKEKIQKNANGQNEMQRELQQSEDANTFCKKKQQ